MKMVKKCLIAIAVVALLAATVQAADPANMKHEGTWPWTKTYEAVDLCSVKVTLEVGHFVQIENCTNREIKLVQVPCDSIGKGGGDFPCYEDCENIKARANFEATFGAGFTGSDVNIIDGKDVYWEGGNTIPGDGEWVTLHLCMKAWKVKLWDSGTGKTSGTVKVGTIMITVKPQTETGGSW